MGGRTIERQRVMDAIREELKLAGVGLSTREIAEIMALPQGRVARSLAALRSDGRAFMGGLTRNARWATTQFKADKAAVAARAGR